MRSLTTKLTVAFLVMGICGAVLVASIVIYRTRLEFDEFVISHDYAVMIDILADYYAQNQSWDGVDQVIHRIPILANHSDRMNLVNAFGQVVFSYQKQAIGEQWAVEVLQNSLEVTVDGQVVAYLLIENPSTSSEFDLSIFGWADRLLWSAVDQPADESADVEAQNRAESLSKSDQDTLCDDLFGSQPSESANSHSAGSDRALFSTDENRYQITYQHPPEPPASPKSQHEPAPHVGPESSSRLEPKNLSHSQEQSDTREERQLASQSDGRSRKEGDRSSADGRPRRGGDGGRDSESRSGGPRGGGHGSESRSGGPKGGGHGSESRSGGPKDGDQLGLLSESLSQAIPTEQIRTPTEHSADQLPELLAEDSVEGLDSGTVVIKLLVASDDARLALSEEASPESLMSRSNRLPETLSSGSLPVEGDLSSELRPCRLPEALSVDRPEAQSEPQPETLSHQAVENRSEEQAERRLEDKPERRPEGRSEERYRGAWDERFGGPGEGRSGGRSEGAPEGPRDDRFGGPRNRPSQETDFLDNVAFAGTVSALAASMMALILGTLLARTLGRPIRTLTDATDAMSRGELGLQVDIESHDEIGQLAISFNQMSAELARAQATRQQMTADIAHDLRTPLSILRLYTEGLENGDLSSNQKIYQVMHQEVLYLQDLVGNLHTLSLADAGQLTLNLRPIDPKALLERTGLAYAMQAEEQGIILRLDAPNNLPSVAVDTTCMTQVLNNLVSNALRFTEEGEIVLEATANQDSVQLQVRDTGAGIAPDDLPHVFNRFYRADKSRQRSQNSSNPKASSGLGLAIAKAIVKAHDGTISVESVLGEGTTFSITLPTVTKKM